MDFLLRFLLCLGLTFFTKWIITLATPDDEEIRLPLTILFSAPFWALLFSRYMVSFAADTFRAVRHAVYAPDQGRYYEFHGVQLRYELLDGAVWFFASDVERLLESRITDKEKSALGRNYAKAPRSIRWRISESGVLHLLKVRTNSPDCSRHMLKLRQWLENETLPSIKKYHEA